MQRERSYLHLLSTDDALVFVKDKLGIHDFLDQFKSDKKGSLNSIIKHYLATVPFQGATFLAAPPGVRIAPSMQENVQFCLSTEGGRCWTLNTFVCVLLDALGYEVYPVISSVAVPDTPNHALTIVKNLVKDGDRYLVDVGFARPNFEAISMDFDEETEVFQYSFDVYKYVRRGEKIIRFNKIPKNDPIGPMPTVEGDFTHAYYFTMEQATFAEIQHFMNVNMYQKPDMIFWNSLRMVRFPEGRAVAIKDNVLLTEQENGKMKGEPITDMEETICNYFPSIPKETVKGMLVNWQKDIEPKLMKA